MAAARQRQGAPEGDGVTVAKHCGVLHSTPKTPKMHHTTAAAVQLTQHLAEEEQPGTIHTGLSASKHSSCSVAKSGSHTHPQVALVRVENDRDLVIELALQLHHRVVDGRLEIAVLSVHHQAHIFLQDDLRFKHWLAALASAAQQAKLPEAL